MFLLQSLLIHIQGNIHVDNFEMVCKVLKWWENYYNILLG